MVGINRINRNKDMTREETIAGRRNKLMTAFLEQLKRTPVIEQACQKCGVSCSTVCRWRRENKRFDRGVETALNEGRLFMSDIAETQLFSLIGEKEFKAIKFYLETHNKRYAGKLELSGTIENKNEPLTKEQQKLIRKALELSSFKNHGDTGK